MIIRLFAHIRLLIIALLLFQTSSLIAQNWQASDLEIYDRFEDMEHIFHYDNDTTYLINFWATWCGPCIKEMPYIEALHEHFADDKLKVILVSLDFERQIESRLIPYLNKNNIQSKVVLLLDGKANRWIDKVDPQWSGAIPITIVYNKKKRLFFEKEFHDTQELVDIINSI